MAGFLAALSASVIWGFTPLFFTGLNHVSRDEVLAHRIVWACLMILVYCAATGRLPHVGAAFRNRRVLAGLVLTTAIMNGNWFLFLLAVAAGRVFEVGLAYYMMPLISVALGVVLLRERLSRLQWAAVALAGLAVAVLDIGLGVAPWLPLTLATSFAVYGFVRKRLDVGSIVGFLVEILMVTPLMLVWLAGVHWLGWQGVGGEVRAQFGTDMQTSLLLVASGVMTSVPFILFSEASRRIDLATVGLVQYVNPSLQVAAAGLILGVQFTPWHWWALALIWLALALYGRELIRQGRARRSAASSDSVVAQTVR